MIRQRFFTLLTSMTVGVVFFSTTASVFAATAFVPTNIDSDTPQGIHSMARTAKLFQSLYTATAAVNHNITTKSYASLTQALTWAKTETNAVVVNDQTGAVVYSNYSLPYEVAVLSPNQGHAVSQKFFANLAEAENAANQTANSFVVNLVTGAILYNRVQGNYVVKSGSSPSLYQSYTDALSAAAQQPVSSIISMATGQTVWNALYHVTVNGQFAKSFATLTAATAYAQQDSQSAVINNATGKDVWDNIPRYDVYQNGILVKQFSTESAAFTYAKSLSNVTVVDIATQQTVYTNVPNFMVEVGTSTLKSFVDETSAITYAKTVSGAVVIQISNNQVVWSSVGLYAVYRYSQLVRSFSNSQDAVNYAKTLDHAEVIDTQTDQVVYSNYPSTIATPNGDTFTVQNGMVVDQWGNENITWAPAPSFMTAGQTYVTDDYTHWYEVTPSGDTYVGEWENPYRTLNLMTPSSLTAAQINSFIANNAVASSVLQNTGNYFIEAQQTFGVNAQYLLAHAIIESAWGTSNFAENRDNLFGYEAYTSNPDAAASFRSIEYDINFQGWFVRNEYLNSSGSFFNGPNLDGMNVDYATDPYWSNSIARIMAEIAPYSPTMSNQPPMGESSMRKVFPYPTGAMGSAVGAITVYSAPQDSTSAPQVVGNIAKGATFSVLGDTPGWDEVVLPNNQTGFVDWNLVSLQNMLEVKGISYGSSLNLRSSASSTGTIIDGVSNGSYLVLLSSSNGWDDVTDGNGKSGWVSSQYVQVIH